ncbi:hypothetical protein PTNB73_07280 [Pyrenophora teres f. teres]|nr:hypothetical protein PTNB73_07280 [Pyrenophora teres f. teres]
MSLFGGSAPRPRSSYESDTPESSSVPSSPSVVETEDPGDIPEIHTLDAAAAEEEEDTDTDSRAESNESEDDEEESEKTARVRRNTNQAQKWRNTTEGELQIMDSIEQMEAEDLVAHLYNTHALKRRVRRPTQDLAQLKSWQGRDSWLKTGKDLEFKDAAGLVQPELVPPKAWTAWPDSPEKLLRSKTQWASDFALEWHIGGVRDALEELKEELLAIFLRLARKQWDQRESPLSESDAEEPAETSRSRSREGSTTPANLRPTSRADGDMDDGEIDEEDIDLDGYSHDETYDTGNESTSRRKRGRRAYFNTLTKPTVLADDAKAQRLLQPTIQSMISRLDRLALAIFRTRLNHFTGAGGSNADTSDADTSDADTSDSESTRSALRSPSRARSRSVTSPESSSSSSSSEESTSDDHTRLQNLRFSDFDQNTVAAWDHGKSTLRRLKRERREERHLERKRRRSSSSQSDGEKWTIKDDSIREGLMDWSELLGLAAVQGWDPEAIARTAQRCATLFDESMSFIPLPESQATKPPLEPVLYTPCTIPAPPIVPSNARSPALNRPFFQTGTLRCPHPDCYGSKKDFPIPYRTIEHCIRVHGYDPRTNKSHDEEGVADGFLQPVTLRPGWFGNGRPKVGNARKRAKSKHVDSQDTSEVDVGAGE